MPNNAPKPVKRGPKPDTLKIEGDWKDAVKKSLAKKKPAAGWPKDESKSLPNPTVQQA